MQYFYQIFFTIKKFLFYSNKTELTEVTTFPKSDLVVMLALPLNAEVRNVNVMPGRGGELGTF